MLCKGVAQDDRQRGDRRTSVPILRAGESLASRLLDGRAAARPYWHARCSPAADGYRSRIQGYERWTRDSGPRTPDPGRRP